MVSGWLGIIEVGWGEVQDNWGGFVGGWEWFVEIGWRFWLIGGS